MTYADLTKEERRAYIDLDSASKDYPIEILNKVIRFKGNTAVQWASQNIDLNKMWIAYRNGAMSIEDLMQFYRMMGYSLCGFLDIFGDYL